MKSWEPKKLVIADDAGVLEVVWVHSVSAANTAVSLWGGAARGQLDCGDTPIDTGQLDVRIVTIPSQNKL